MFENIMNFFKKLNKKEDKITTNSKEAAKERLHLVLMQDRANVSADFLELMKQEIIEVIKKYIDVDESAIDVRLTNKENGDGTNGAPALYANIPILNIKNEARKVDVKKDKIKSEINEKETKKEESKNDMKLTKQKENVEKNHEEKISEIESKKIDEPNQKEKNKQELKNEEKSERLTKDEIKSEKK